MPPLKKEAETMGSTIPRRVNRIVFDHFVAETVAKKMMKVRK